MTERLQKVLARAGYGSRRSCEEIIREGRVLVDGEVAEIGKVVDLQINRITVDGELVDLTPDFIYLMFYKPRGVLSSSRSQGGHKTLYSFIDVDQRIYPVGRLDLHSEGLMLLTNDGALTYRLTHPRFRHEKEYLVELSQLPSEEQLQLWREGLQLPDGIKTLPAEVMIDPGPDAGVWIRIVLREGRKRQIRLSADVLGLQVKRLIRIRLASLELEGLRPGEYRHLLPEELETLKVKAGLAETQAQ